MQQPTLTQVEAYYLSVFTTLNNSRQPGASGLGPIGLDAISHYCHLYCVHDPQERIVVVRLMQALDRAFLQHHAKPAL